MLKSSPSCQQPSRRDPLYLSFFLSFPHLSDSLALLGASPARHGRLPSGDSTKIDCYLVSVPGLA